MIDPTFGWGEIVIDELKSYFNWFGEFLYTKLIGQLFEYITGIAIPYYSCHNIQQGG